MAPPQTSSARVVQDARLLLETIRGELADGRQPYASDVRRIIERGLALRFAEYVQFLERYGFVSLDRKSDLLTISRAGHEVADGHEARLLGLEGDARYHFGDRLAQIDVEAPTVDVEGSKLDGRYVRYELLGKGGLGTVSRGRHLATDRAVALKVLDNVFELFTPDQHDEIVRRLELAVREHARLISPFIVQVLDQNPRHDPPYYAMELAPGGSLRALLAQGPLPPVVALRYFIQIALGLKAAHGQGVLHRDLKPENVLLDASGNVKLCDFGVTRIAERDGDTVRQAYVGFGSVGYMAPELFRAPQGAGPSADVYALGILLYEMLTGELPGRRSPMPSEVVEGVPADLDDVFDQMTQDLPERRPQSVDDVLTRVWTSAAICALLDARQAPCFVEPPVALPGLDALGPPPNLAQASAPAASAPEAKPPTRAAAPAPEPAPATAPATTSAPPESKRASVAAAPAPAPEAEPSAPPTSAPAAAPSTPPQAAPETTAERPRPSAPFPRPTVSKPPAPLQPFKLQPDVVAKAETPAPIAPAFPDDGATREQRSPGRGRPVAHAVPVEPPATAHDEAPDDSIVDPPDPALFAEAEADAERFAEHSIEEIDLVEVEELMSDSEVRRFGTDVHDEPTSKADAIDEKLDRLRGR